MGDPPIARSPVSPASPEVVVAGWAVSGRRSTAALRLTDCSPLATVVVRAPPGGATAAELGVAFGHAARRTVPLGDHPVPLLVVGSGPDEWRVLAPPGTQSLVVDRVTAVAAVAPDELVTVVDLTHGTALMRLTGDRSAELLARETAVDLADRACPDGAALRTALAGLAVDVVRDDQAGVRSYLVGCERSSGQYLFDCLLESGADLGVDVDGFLPTAMEESDDG